MEASLAYKTKKIVEKYGFSFKKNFGQNFLVDERVLGKIVSSAEISKDDVVRSRSWYRYTYTGSCKRGL